MLSVILDVVLVLGMGAYVFFGLLEGADLLNSGGKNQKEWIYETLPKKLWEEQTTDLANSEYHRIVDVLENYANAAIRRYDEAGTEKDLDEYLSMSFFGLEDLYLLGGGSSANEKKRAAQIDRYKKQYESVTDNLLENMKTLLRLRDSTLAYRPAFSDEQLCRILLGTPGAIATPSAETQMSLARSVMTNLYRGREKPTVSSCTYDRKEKVWNVRMDGAPNQEVQFFKRDDGGFDIEWTGNKGYVPQQVAASYDDAADEEEDPHPSHIEPESYSSIFSGVLKDGAKEYKIEMTLQIDEFGAAEGYYRYMSQAATSRIPLSGSVEQAGMMIYYELDSQDGTEHFSLSQTNVAETDEELKQVEGHWRKYKSSSDRERDEESFTKHLDVKLVEGH